MCRVHDEAKEAYLIYNKEALKGEKMENTTIIDIYQGATEKEVELFKKNLESKLHVKTDYEKVIKDTEWIKIMEDTIPYLDNIFRAPNRFIINEEEIVKIERARRITVESIKNLSRNTSFIQEVDKKTGDVKPSKILNIDKEESYDTYENRLIYTLIQNMKFFLSVKKKTLEQFQNVDSKNNKIFDYNGNTRVANQSVNLNLSLSSNTIGGETKPNKADEIIERISQLEVKISDLTGCDVYKIIDKKHIALVREPIKKTNVVLKNVNFQYAMKLWTYLRDNLEDKTKKTDEKEDYDDNSNLKELMDDAFFMNYLIMNTIDKDKEEPEELEKQKKKEMQQIVISKLLEKIAALDSNLSVKDVENMIGEKYAVIKYKNQASAQEIQKIFSKHIEKYLEKINKNGGN